MTEIEDQLKKEDTTENAVVPNEETKELLNKIRDIEDPGSTPLENSPELKAAAPGVNEGLLVQPATTQITEFNETKKTTPGNQFEKEIIGPFSLPENIKDIVAEIQSLLPAISLDLALATLSEEYSFLDYFNDQNIIFIH